MTRTILTLLLVVVALADSDYSLIETCDNLEYSLALRY
jgi:hypothetical protein